MKRTKGIQADVEKLHNLQVLSQLVSRATLLNKFGSSYDGDRDLYEALGYKQQLTVTDYYTQYARQDIAKAIIDRPVKMTWKGDLSIMESNDDQETKFEKEINELDDFLHLKTIFVRLDKLVSLGTFGVLLFGFNDVPNNEGFKEEVKKSKALKLMYIKPYNEKVVQVSEVVTDPTSERYGLPLMYKIEGEDAAKNSVTLNVHYTRILHVVYDELEIETEGTPVLQAVYNRLQDLEKIIGGSGEMYWRGARPGYQAKIDPDFTMTPEDIEDLRTKIDEYEHNLRRILTLKGAELEALAAQVSDPKGAVDVQIQMISAQTGIPKRILTGSERGELSSSQDADEWNTYIQTRREEYAEPKIIKPFINRLQELEILSETKEGYTVMWSDLFTKSDKDKAEVGKVRALSLKEYASQPTAVEVMSPQAFLTMCLGLDEEDIELINEMNETYQEELEAQMEAEAMEFEEAEEVIEEPIEPEE